MNEPGDGGLAASLGALTFDVMRELAPGLGPGVAPRAVREHPAVADVAAALRAHPAIGRNVDGMLLTVMGGSEVRAEDVALLAARQVIVSLSSDPSVDSAVSSIERDLVDVFGRADVPFRLVWPLPSLATTMDPISLDAGLELAPLAEEELAQLRSVGFDRFWPNTYALRARTRASRLSSQEIGQARTDENISAARAQIERFTRALRLLKPDRLETPVEFHSIDSWIGGSAGAFSMSIRRLYPRGYALNQAEVPELRRIAHALSNPAVMDDGALQVALRRVEVSSSRESPQDELIDLMVAAEAVFTSGSNAEVTFRMSTRAGHLLGPEPDSKAGIKRQMAHAHDTRSRIVHGDAVSNERLNEDLAATREIVRRALIRFVTSVAETGIPVTQTDWDAVTFGT